MKTGPLLVSTHAFLPSVALGYILTQEYYTMNNN